MVSEPDDQILPLSKARSTSQKLYYSDNRIKVSSKLIRLGGTDYSIRNLTSVSRVRIDPDYLWKMVIYAVMGGLIGFLIGAIIGIVIAGSNYQAQTNIALVALLAGVVIGAVLARLQAKPRFFVRFKTAAGEEGSLESPEYTYIEQVANAIARAMMENQ